MGHLLCPGSRASHGLLPWVRVCRRETVGQVGSLPRREALTGASVSGPLTL